MRPPSPAQAAASQLPAPLRHLPSFVEPLAKSFPGNLGFVSDVTFVAHDLLPPTAFPGASARFVHSFGAVAQVALNLPQGLEGKPVELLSFPRPSGSLDDNGQRKKRIII